MAWNRPNDDGSATSMKPPQSGHRPRAIVWGISAIVVLCVAATWWIFRTPTPTGPSTGSGKPLLIKEVKPSLDIANKARGEKVKEAEIDPEVAKTNGIVSALNPEGRLFLSIVSNSTGMIITTYRRANGTLVEVLDWVQPKVKLSATDQLLRMVTSSADGGPPAPVNPNDRSLDAVFKKTLEKPLEIKDDDSDATRKLKERLNNARADMDALMNQSGASFSEIITEHQRTASENTAILNAAQSLINESLKKGDKDGAAIIYQQFSERLEQLGVTGLTLDPVLDDDNEEK